MTGTLVSIQYLRAVAALMVVVYHMHHWAVPLGFEGAWPTWLKSGVDIFFVISGYIMVATTDGRDMPPAKFYLNRIKRIAPIYWVLTLVAIASVGWSGWHSIASLLFLPALHPEREVFFPVIIPGWTLNYEMFFYLIFGATLALRKTIRILLTGGILATLVLVGWVFEAEGVGGFYTRPIILEFAFGMLIARLRWTAPAIALPIGFTLIPLLDSLTDIRIIAFGLPAFLIVSSVIGLEKRMPHWWLPKFIGDGSYSIYLLHVTILGLVAPFVHMMGLGWQLYMVVAFICAIAAGLALFWFVERPIARILSRKSLGQGNQLQPQQVR